MTSAAPALTDARVAEFAEQGYLVLPDVFSADEVRAAQREAERILEMVLDSSFVNRRRNPRIEIDLGDATVTVRKVQPVNDLSQLLAAMSCDERLIAPMRQLMHDEPVLMEEKLNLKQTVDVGGRDFSFIHRTTPESFPLHHDWGYYRSQGYPRDIISSAIALDDCAGRGPIRVIPGSHRIDAPMADDSPSGGGGEWGGSGVVADGFMADVPRVPVEATAGSVMLFHALLLHDSEPNRSGQPRRVMIYSHQPRRHEPHGEPDRRNAPIRTYARDFEERWRTAVGTATGTTDG